MPLGGEAAGRNPIKQKHRDDLRGGPEAHMTASLRSNVWDGK
jgi:hypothetical protein